MRFPFKRVFPTGRHTALDIFRFAVFFYLVCQFLGMACTTPNKTEYTKYSPPRAVLKQEPRRMFLTLFKAFKSKVDFSAHKTYHFELRFVLVASEQFVVLLMIDKSEQIEIF